MSASFVPGRYWNVSGEIVIAPNPASAKRFAKSARNIKGALSSLRARLATEEEISDYISKEPERVAANDRARREREATERLHAAAPYLLRSLKELLSAFREAVGADAFKEFQDGNLAVFNATVAISKAEGFVSTNTSPQEPLGHALARDGKRWS